MTGQLFYRGLKVVVSEHVKPQPVLRTSPDFKWCTDAARAKHDAWLLERFGTTTTAFVIGNTVMMAPEQYAVLKRQQEAALALLPYRPNN